jgi:CDP-glucose 4,6-dehydratase
MEKIDYYSTFNLFKDKKVFITGHTGFKGSWLTSILLEIGADVMGYSLFPEYSPNHFELLNLSSRIKHVIGDIKDASMLSDKINKFKPEFVFHLAAQPLVQKSYQQPVETFNTNVIGTVNLLEAVRNCDSVRSLIVVTSDKCYENVEWIWGYRENDKMGGHDPYSASKGAAELVFSSYSRSYFNSRKNLGYASVRAGNVIGGGDWSDNRIIPDCVKAINKKISIEIRNPYSTRPWQHVLEPLSGYLLLAAKIYEKPDFYSGSWNFGPSSNEVRTVVDVANEMVNYLESGSVMVVPSLNNHEANLLQLNCDKAHQLLNWQPRWGFSETMYYTADWYKKNMLGYDSIEITRKQIKDYFKELI